MGPLSFYQLCLVLLFGGERAVRKTVARQVPTVECANTAAGRHFLTDSHGFVCSRRDLDYTSGCCYSGDLNSCETCHETDRCCSSYEHCVSCCLKPQFNAQELMKTQFRIHHHPTTGKWDDAFQYCMGKCRTHKRSTVHENAFIDDRHFCFSDSSRPKIDKNPHPIPDGVSVHAGAKGADCDVTCTDAGLNCAADAMQATSSCDLLRDHFECEAGCAEGKDSSEVPAYVVYGTPKPLYPTMCFTASPEVELGSCSAAQPHLQRLCACAPWKPAEALVSMESGGENGQKQDIQQGGDANTEADGKETVQASPVEDKVTDSSSVKEDTSADSNDQGAVDDV